MRVGFGPILLKKSFNAVDQIFSASWMHFLNKDAGGHIVERRRAIDRSKWNYEANKSRM